jgi:ECF sigma factor
MGVVHRSVSLSAVEGFNPVRQSDDILSKLEKADPRAARVVELRFFGGLTEDEVAEVLCVSTITVKRDWKAARAWLATPGSRTALDVPRPLVLQLVELLFVFSARRTPA